MTAPKVLLVAHAHPDLSKGGAEIATHHLHHAFRARGIESTFVGHSASPLHAHTSFAQLRDHELLVHGRLVNGFDFRAADGASEALFARDLPELLRRLQPDVVHFAHFVQLGLEWFHVVRRHAPRATIVLTCHEFLAICHADGQMLKRPGRELCHRASPDDCSRCYPEFSPADFFLRREFFRSAFDHVDRFLAPSAFVRDRHVAWGLPADRFDVIENVHPTYPAQPPRPLAPGERRARFAYFGQATVYKGLELALRAFTLLPESLRAEAHLDLHVAGLERLPEDERARLESLAASLGDRATFHGRYEASELPSRMARTDWVLVPSIWWENSPMVIQEAFGFGRPVIAADLGGMAEKVRDGVDGLHFPARDALGLADVLRRAVETEGLWDRLHREIVAPAPADVIVDAHVAAYARGRRG